MAYKDGEDFTTYCDKEYGRHTYKLVLKSGKAVIFDDYETLRAHWFHWKPNCDHIEILDVTSGKGF